MDKLLFFLVINRSENKITCHCVKLTKKKNSPQKLKGK